MPFLTERTALIKAKLGERLSTDSLNDWERSFLTDMDEKFDRDGSKTRLTTAQYRKLHQLLGLQSERTKNTAASADKATAARPVGAPTPKPIRNTQFKRNRSPIRYVSPMRAIHAPQRAVSKASRAVIYPMMLILAVLGMIGAAFDGGSSPSAEHSQAASSDIAVYLVVNGSTVNQREGPGTSNRVMGQLSEGTRVRRLRQQGGWTQIASPLGTGWMSSSFLAPTHHGSSSRTAPLPAVRNSPGTTADARTLQVRDIRVIDGDTVTISGERANVRLVGFNTPETRSPECSAELQVGRTATSRLNTLLKQAGTIEFRRVACACRPGTEGTSRCNFGRQCGSLIVDGTDVGRTLISENLAVPYHCGQTSCPPRPGNWCR
jgi:endonuclease YncB( thermonuclease family)